jgi:hypothetical protein
MRELPLPITSQEWMRQMFATKTALDGGVVRRKVSDVERLIGRDALLGAMKMRGYRVVENAGHFVVFCNSEDVLLRL